MTFGKSLPNGLPNGLPLRLKNYSVAPDFGAISKDSNYIYKILVSKKKRKKEKEIIFLKYLQEIALQY